MCNRYTMFQLTSKTYDDSFAEGLYLLTRNTKSFYCPSRQQLP